MAETIDELQGMEEAGDERETPSLPAKKARRAKYASKACDQCRKRKIKCDGESPCRTCFGKRVECQRSGTDMRGRWRALDRNKASTNTSDLARLSRAERQSSNTVTPESRSRDLNPDAQHSTNTEERRTSGTGSRDASPKVPTFSGETSITHNMTVVENQLEQMGVQYSRLRSASPSHSFRSCLTPSPDDRPSRRRRAEPHAQTSFVRRILDANGLKPNRDHWNELLHTFCDEVHVLVPFLHLPSLWKLYGDVWETSLGDGPQSRDQSGVRRVQIAHILLCLANGRCVESSRFEDGEGRYSAGWSLYNAARDIFGDLLDGFSQCTDQIFVLQTYLLMVVYLFRLDAHGSAEKVLALCISHAHHLGLQRNRVVESMPRFEGEIARRLWWCLYLLDRRLAIETGRPFLIQDINVDVDLPHEVSDEWLEISHGSPQADTSHTNLNLEPVMTSVPYLVAMASYSRVIGKVWEALYGAATSESTPSPLLNEYLEHLITQSQRGIKKEFTYDPHNPLGLMARSLAWWQIKQRFIMRIRWTSLYLLVRKPMLQKAWAPDQLAPDAIENEVICMRLTHSIFDDFNSMPEQHPKYTFPFLHYLTNATIIALALIIKQSSFKRVYGEVTWRAAQSLWEHCRKTWVSGKMARTVWKLNQMADAIINGPCDNGVGRSYPAQAVSSENPHSPSSFSTGCTNSSVAIPLNANLATGRSIDGDESTSNSRRNDRAITDTAERGRNEAASSAYGREDNETSTTRNRRTAEKESSLNQPERTDSYSPNKHGTVHYLDTGTYQHDHPTIQEDNGLDIDISFPGEMIDGGMEWLQSLFVNGLDTQLPPVWD